MALVLTHLRLANQSHRFHDLSATESTNSFVVDMTQAMGHHLHPRQHRGVKIKSGTPCCRSASSRRQVVSLRRIERTVKGC
jgi:hypothetical protein